MKYILSVSKPTIEDIRLGLPATTYEKVPDDEWYEVYLNSLADDIAAIEGAQEISKLKKTGIYEQYQIISKLSLDDLQYEIKKLFIKTDEYEGAFWCKVVFKELCQVER